MNATLSSVPTPLELLIHTEALFESIHTSAAVNELLCAREERVALRANLNSDVLLGGRGVDLSPTNAANSCRFITGMNSLFHLYSPLSSSKQYGSDACALNRRVV